MTGFTFLDLSICLINSIALSWVLGIIIVGCYVDL